MIISQSAVYVHAERPRKQSSGHICPPFLAFSQSGQANNHDDYRFVDEWVWSQICTEWLQEQRGEV